MSAEIEKQGSEVGRLVDKSLEQFKSDMSKENLGYLMSLKNFLTRLYSDLAVSVNAMTEKAKLLKKETEEYNEHISTIMGIFSKMQSIEDKVVFLDEEVKKRVI